ncbi:HET-domain-containing protein [Clathrospora elynae]|uniref:HET-domain-containing protein n=1 Tax=Clathrospora elynae TaxID=706981 RepID=A0A6A5T502_9PLEO|nr:HET-domain-containing protein [Clathrospora elynae]
MLCDFCIGMLSERRGQIMTGMFDLTFEHHKFTTTLRRSVKADCSICTGLAKILESDTDLRVDQALSIRATLKKVWLGSDQVRGSTFTLDFELGKNRSRVFLLTENEESNHQRINTTTPSGDLVDIAQTWMKKCKCAKSWEQPGEKWYPRRLLDLRELRGAHSNLERAKVHLVESKDACNAIRREHDRYITLSHCWGKSESGEGPLKLTFDTEKRFKDEGIRLKELSKTFRDAVVFAARLEKVGYIWIDSLCIRQPSVGPGTNQNEQLKDWFEQSSFMGTVYRKAFLNISATASSNGHGGLLFDRRPEHLWENNVHVYYPEKDPAMSTKSPKVELDSYKRCTVVDVSAWDDLVEKAPINKRGWVLQERLLAPRVLHFCHNQIAWECSEFQAAEGHTDMHLAARLHRTSIFQQGQLKHLTAENGRLFREIRLRGMPDPDKHLRNLYIYELWKRVVETYSQTQLTEDKDKLIALAGIAKIFQDELFSMGMGGRYVAGLWGKNLESQLLWHVNEVYANDGILFDNPAMRCAIGGPSFSWAAIKSPHGITYGDITDYKSPEDGVGELLFRVLDHSITLADPKNPFGMVTAGRLLLAPRYLRRIELSKLPKSRRVPFAWSLKLDPQPKRPKEYTNIYLDAPGSDKDIFGKNAELYCMPAAYGERTERKSDRYLYCLLLKYEKPVVFAKSQNGQKEGRYRGFRRVGIAKLSSMDEGGQIALKEVDTKELICVC